MRATWLAVVVLTALGAALRFATLDTQSFWLDELVTVSLLDRDFADMLEGVRGTEATPYLYYVLAWPWAQVFGLGEVGLRSLSAVVGTLAVPVSYAAGAALCSRRVGVVVAALVAVHPFLVWYAQEARSYSLLVLLGACVVLFLGRALRAPLVRCRGDGTQGRPPRPRAGPARARGGASARRSRPPPRPARRAPRVAPGRGCPAPRSSRAPGPAA